MQMEVSTATTSPASQATGEQPSAEPKKYVGDGRDIILQGFHWGSHQGIKDRDGKRKSWYTVLAESAETIKAAGFTWVWFPPPSDSLSANGYIPRRWNLLDTAYGTETELRAAIKALDPVKVMADIVLNHRVGVKTGGADFEDPPFPDNAAAVARDDDCRLRLRQPGHGRDVRRRPRPGPHQPRRSPGDRDLPAPPPGSRLQRLALRPGQGLLRQFIGEYNDATNPGFSVGEFFDGDRQKVTHWIDRTGGKSGAFDFPTRYRLYEACTSDDYGGLRGGPWPTGAAGAWSGMWPSRSVTFVDSHDTEYRREGEFPGTHHFPGSTAVMGYAYLLTHPGVPCVFWSHLFDWGPEARECIQRLIQVRKNAGLHARSAAAIHEARQGLYAATIDGKVAVKLGSRDWNPGGGWQLAAHGDRFAVWSRD